MPSTTSSKASKPAATAPPSNVPSKKSLGPVATTPHLAVVHRLHALLHTMRAIEGHEEHLCSLLHHIQTTGQLAPAVSRELGTLLHQLPVLAYQADLDALQQSLAPPKKATARAPR